MKLGVYIGSFNPVHIGHISIVNYLLDNGIVDKVLIVPTVGYWDKTNMVDIKDRINMLKFFETESILVDSIHNEISYTYELMRKLKEEYDSELHLIIGADNLISFDKWKNYEELLTYKIIVMNRDNISIDSLTSKYDTPNFIVLNDFPLVDVSSTKIRENISEEYLDKRVYQYIKDNNLYK